MSETQDYYLPQNTLDQAKTDTIRGVKIQVTPEELVQSIKCADKALNGDSNDDEHDALYELREWLSELLEDPERRVRP